MQTIDVCFTLEWLSTFQWLLFLFLCLLWFVNSKLRYVTVCCRYHLLSEVTKSFVTHDKLTAVTDKPALSFSISVHHVKAAVSAGC